MDSTTLMVVIGLIAAVIGGYFVARKSHELEKVRGGVVAQAFHYLASAGMSGIPAALLVALIATIFTPDKILGEFVKYAILNLVVVFGALLIYGVVEPDPAVK